MFGRPTWAVCCYRKAAHTSLRACVYCSGEAAADLDKDSRALPQEALFVFERCFRFWHRCAEAHTGGASDFGTSSLSLRDDPSQFDVGGIRGNPVRRLLQTRRDSMVAEVVLTYDDLDTCGPGSVRRRWHKGQYGEAALADAP